MSNTDKTPAPATIAAADRVDFVTTLITAAAEYLTLAAGRDGGGFTAALQDFGRYLTGDEDAPARFMPAERPAFLGAIGAAAAEYLDESEHEGDDWISVAVGVTDFGLYLTHGADVADWGTPAA